MDVAGERVLAGRELRLRRRQLGLTQAALATALGVTRNTLARWERDEVPMSNPALVRLGLERLEAPSLAEPVGAPTPEICSGSGDTARALPRTRAPAAQLPTPLTSLVGREPQVRQVSRFLQSTRLVTVTGPGGVGKTRLALRVAERVRDRFADGAAFVELVAVADPRLVEATLARAVAPSGAVEHATRDLLVRALRDRQLLLILDNFEQVLEAAPVLTHVLGACPSVTMLVTSRAPLRASGEQVFCLAPLQPSESIALFVQRARAVSPTFDLTADKPVVAQICARLDGLPLAIELAAAQVRFASPRAILGDLGGGLDLLADAPRDAPARHQTMRAAIAWSYDLLRDQHKQVFRRVSVFNGGFSAEAAQMVAADPPDAPGATQAALRSLVDHALIQVTRPTDPVPRFGLLQPIREFGLEVLERSGEDTAVHERHARYYLCVAEQLAPISQTYNIASQAALEVVGRELDNLRAALRWALDNDAVDLALALAESSQAVFQVRGHYAEARRWCSEVLARTANTARDPRRVRLLLADARAADRVTELAEAHRRCAEALTIARELGDPSLIAGVLYEAALNAEHRGDYGASRALAEEAVGVCRALGDRVAASQSVHALAWLDCQEEAYAAAHARAAANLALGRELDSAHITALALKDLGYAALGLGKMAVARSALEEGLLHAQRHGYPWASSTILEGLGHVSAAGARPAEARGWFQEALRVCRDIGDRRGVVRCLEGLACLDAVERRPERALLLIGASGALRDQLGLPRSPRERRLLDVAQRHIRQQLGAAAAGSALARGQRSSLGNAVALVLDRDETPAPAPPGRRRVTGRELEVAELVAAGLTNRQIAARLCVGDRTVQTHVAHLLQKLQVSTRAEIAAWLAGSAETDGHARTSRLRHVADGFA